MLYEVDQQRIRMLVQESGLTNVALAKKLGMSTRSLYGKLHSPNGHRWTGPELADLASATMTSPGAFFKLKVT